MSPPAIEMAALEVPEDVAAPDASDFRAMVEIRNRVQRVVFGEQAVVITPTQALPAWKDQTNEEIHGFLVRADGEPVGRALLYVPLEDGSRSAQLQVDILPEWWGRGIGRFAAERLERAAAERGRTVLHSFTNHRQLGGERVTARTGWGSVPDDHVSRAVRAAGFELEQVYRSSALDLTRPLDGIRSLLETALAAASGYRYLSWTLPTPPEYRDGYAWMKSRMSTDAPTGDIEVDEEAWDADRVARLDERLVAQGFFGLIGAVEHVASGELVAYNELYVIGDDHTVTHQNDTLVLKEHRGHRLGLLVKCQNLLRWRELVPESTKVLTNNAEENRPMLDVNEAMGFEPIAYAGAWQKTRR